MNIRPSSRPSGQTLVEFAIILPVLLLIVLVVFDLGRAIYFYTMLTNAAREGARFGSTESTATTDQIRMHVYDYAAGIDLQLGDITVDNNKSNFVTVDDSNLNKPVTRNDINVEVTIDFDFVPITPYVSRLLPGGALNIQIKSRMGREYK